MSIFIILLKQSRWLLASAMACSLVYGLVSVMLIAEINTALTSPGASLAGSIGAFAALAVAMLTTQVTSGVLFTHLSQHTLANLRLHISRQVIGASYRQLEETGAARVQALLSDDTSNVAAFFVGLPVLLANGAIVIGCFAYLSSLSGTIFLLACGVVLLGSLGYHLAHGRVIRYLQRAGDDQDQLFRHFEAMVKGAKELKLNRHKADAFASDVLASSIHAVRVNRALGMSLFSVAAGWGRFLFFVLIGLALSSPLWQGHVDARVITGYVIVFLYVMAPLENLLQHIPLFNLAKVSSDRIEEVTGALPGGETAAGAGARQPWHGTANDLVMDGVMHRYYREREDQMFTLGPIHLHLRTGELVFLVGSNGCGKTTLAKLLLGLYAPESGGILLDGVAVDDSNRDHYRQTFSAIFADFHLFDSLTGAPSDRLDEQGNEWLRRLQLDHKVTLENGAFSTRDLSQGQRKRLALVATCLEDRPFLVFDEWASDQDPAFRDVFYREILPDLRARGKTVLVISHDDRYFHLGDRLLRMEDGRIASEERFEPAAPRSDALLVEAA